MSNPDTIYVIFEKLFSGFGISMLLAYTLLLFKSEALKEFSNKLIHYAITVIKILGIVYFTYYLIRIITSYSINELLFSKRATGQYAWAYWMMLLRPLAFCLLVQLFWIKKIKNSKRYAFTLTFIVFFLVLASGQNLERFIIMITSFHRDYLPSNWSLNSYGALYILLWIENTFLFSGLVFITWFLSERFKKQ